MCTKTMLYMCKELSWCKNYKKRASSATDIFQILTTTKQTLNQTFLRATVCKYRESGVSREIFNFLIFCSNNLYSELFSKILLKGPEAL